MQDHDLRRPSEHLWNAWMELNYAAADLTDEGDQAAIRRQIGSCVEQLRVLAETVDLLAAGAAPEG